MVLLWSLSLLFAPLIVAVAVAVVVIVIVVVVVVVVDAAATTASSSVVAVHVVVVDIVVVYLTLFLNRSLSFLKPEPSVLMCSMSFSAFRNLAFRPSLSLVIICSSWF